jgi:hypothetical protein
MTALGGNLREAIARWHDVLEDPRNDEEARAIATRQIRTLTVKADLQDLTAAIDSFRSRNGRAPRSLEEMVRGGVLNEIPLDPDGKRYVFDPATATVSSPAGRLLGS